MAILRFNPGLSQGLLSWSFLSPEIGPRAPGAGSWEHLLNTLCVSGSVVGINAVSFPQFFSSHDQFRLTFIKVFLNPTNYIFLIIKIKESYHKTSMVKVSSKKKRKIIHNITIQR